MEWQEALFVIMNVYVMPFWFIMIVLPNKRFTKGALESLWIFVPLLLVYTAVILPGFAEVFASVSNPEYTAIRELLGSASGALLAWVHLLAFDLFAGRWMYFDSQTRGLNTRLTGVALFFTLMSGPFGLLLYFVFCRIQKGK